MQSSNWSDKSVLEPNNPHLFDNPVKTIFSCISVTIMDSGFPVKKTTKLFVNKSMLTQQLWTTSSGGLLGGSCCSRSIDWVFWALLPHLHDRKTKGHSIINSLAVSARMVPKCCIESIRRPLRLLLDFKGTSASSTYHWCMSAEDTGACKAFWLLWSEAKQLEW